MERTLFESPVCERHCEWCEGQDHHWMPDFNEDTGEMIMGCKHCEATREVRDSDLDDEIVEAQ